MWALLEITMPIQVGAPDVKSEIWPKRVGTSGNDHHGIFVKNEGRGGQRRSLLVISWGFHWYLLGSPKNHEKMWHSWLRGLASMSWKSGEAFGRCKGGQ